MKYLFLMVILASCSHKKVKEPLLTLHQLTGLVGQSGLVLESKSNDLYTFWSHTDRGPNATEYKRGNTVYRPFLEPEFHPYWVKFSVNKKSGEFKKISQVDTDISGLPNRPGDEFPVDVHHKKLKRDPRGADPESMCRMNGFVWMGEEYRPSILKFDQNGKLVNRYIPGKGLPAILAKRKVNRGLEGLTCFNNKIYAILQSPLKEDKNLIRLVEFDPHSESVTREFFYPLDSMDADKIGDLAVTEDGTFFVIEQNSLTGPQSFHKIYSFKLGEANSLEKKFEVDITKSGFYFSDKLEGLVVTDEYFIIVNDNDFGLVNDKFDPEHKSWIGFIKR